MAERWVAATLVLLALGACANPRAGDGAFHHIGTVGTGCRSPPPGPLRIEAPAGQGVFRISNASNQRLDLHYDWASSFGDYQMFFIRFRDASGNLQHLHGQNCGWWSPKEYHANLEGPGEWPERRRLTIPAHGHLDIPIDQPALTYWWGFRHNQRATGPCAMQVRLYGYPGRRTWDSVGAETDWLPVPCPPVHQGG